jgi:hypothetical protein
LSGLFQFVAWYIKQMLGLGRVTQLKMAAADYSTKRPHMRTVSTVRKCERGVMQVEELKYSADAQEQIRIEIKDLIDTSPSLEQLLRAWFSKADRGVSVGRGISDEDPHRLSVCVVLRADEKRLAEIYFPDSAILPKDTSIVNINDFVSEAHSTFDGMPFDDEKFDAWQKLLGFEYDDFLCCELAPWDALMPYTLAYVFSQGGEVDIAPANPDVFEADIDDEGAIDLDSVLCMYATFQVAEPVAGGIFGFDTIKYFWKENHCMGRGTITPEVCAYH